MIFEAVGDNASMAFEWSFKPILQPLLSYNKLIQWGQSPDAELDRLWSFQLAIADEEFCNGGASVCIHATDEYVTRIDCELSGRSELGLFMNSSLPQFGESMLAATQWATKYRDAEKNERRAAFSQLINSLTQIDPAIVEGANGLVPYWPDFLDAFDDDEALRSFDITSDPERSKPRF